LFNLSRYQLSLTIKISNSLLSPPPESEPSLPTLPIALFFQLQGIHQPVKYQLANSDSILFTRGLFSCTVIDGTPLLVQLCCLQPNCNYAPKLQPLLYKQTGNYWTYYNHSYPTIIITTRQQQYQSTSQSSSYSTSIASLFILYKPVLRQLSNNVKSRKLLLNFIVSNNLALQLVDQPSFQQLVQYLNLSALIISTSILNQDLEKAFLFACNILKTELQEYVKAGSRISITTDTWSARNYKEFIAVTGYWIDKS
jgi:hypothetical protein